MQFEVPQFIEIEDKIFGPLTFKQFVYVAGGAGMSFVIYTTLPFFLAILFIIPVGALALGLAFYKVNNRPFIDTLESALGFFTSSKMYIWKKEFKKQEEKKEVNIADQYINQLNVPKLSDSKLKDLSWSLDIKDNV